MNKLIFPFMFVAVLAGQIAFGQESSQPAPKQPSALAGTDSPEGCANTFLYYLR
jgi:hypothetical protein